MLLKVCKERENVPILTIYVEGEAWRRVHTTLFGKRLSIPSQCETMFQLTEWFENFERQQIRAYIGRLLSKRAYCSAEIHQRLRKLQASPVATQDAIDWAVEMGFIQDEAWVESFVRGQMARQQGPGKIRQKLRERGVNPQEADQILLTVSQKELILSRINKKYKSLDFKDFKQKNRVIRGLLQKGFDLDAIQEVLHEIG